MELVNARKPIPDDEESDWLYYDPPTKRWHRVVLLVVPEEAKRVRIQHLEAGTKGKAEWVPVGRCKVPWSLRDDYFATIEAWNRLASHDPDPPHRAAATDVLLMLVEESVASPSLRSAALEISDAAQLSAATNIDVGTLTGHPDVVVEDGIVHAPWPVTLQVVQSLCRLHPETVTKAVRDREKELHNLAIEQEVEGGPWYDDPNYRDDRFAQRVKGWATEEQSKRRILMRWVGGPQPDLASRHEELRSRHIELTLAILPALDQLAMIRSQKAEMIAAQIRSIIERPMP